MAVKAAVLSDTHGLLRTEVLEAITGCDVIIHGGDINKQEVLDKLQQLAPVYAVRGNNDKEWAEQIPKTLTISIEDCRIFVVHNRKGCTKGLRRRRCSDFWTLSSIFRANHRRAAVV